MHTMEADGRGRDTPYGKQTPQVKKNPSAKTLGIPGYYVAKSGLPKREPNYTIPKDENQGFFKHVTRATRGVPGPNHYPRAMSWKTPNG